MSKISDEIRERWNGYFEQRNGDCEWFHNIADRIDNEMVELPRDADGVPIHVGETLYLPSGVKVGVNRIFIGQGEPSIECAEFLKTKFLFSRNANDFTHTTPDSWESIADEMDKFADDTPGIDTFYASTASRLRDFADRIRRLAAKED